MPGQPYGVLEIWLQLRYDCWGNGYATEAAKAMMDYVRREFGVTHFCASHAEPNLASGKVIEKCGLKFIGTPKKCLYNTGKSRT